jgi:hypothetical protein
MNGDTQAGIDVDLVTREWGRKPAPAPDDGIPSFAELQPREYVLLNAEAQKVLAAMGRKP